MSHDGPRIAFRSPWRPSRSIARRGPAAAGKSLPGERVRLGFWAGEDFVIVGASLINLSRDGLLVIADCSVPRNRSAWIRFDGTVPIVSVAVTVLGTTPLRHGRCAARLELGEDVPAGFYESAVRRLAPTR